MNGKKAKMLRGLAGVNKQSQDARTYHGAEHTVRNKVIKDFAGEVTHRFRTATYQMNANARVMYKMLKKQYVRGFVRT